MSKKLSEMFSGVTPEVRTIAIRGLKLSANVSDADILKTLDHAIELNNKQGALKAQLGVENMINAGMLNPEKKDLFIRLAQKDYNTTMELISGNYSKSLELQELLKLTGRQLWYSDKLERLKQLSEPHFNIKLADLNSGDREVTFKKSVESFSEAPFDNNDQSLDELKKLSGKELYLNGNLEKLKELDFEVFKLKYKEVFRVNYPQ